MGDVCRVGTLISGGGRTVLNLAEKATQGDLPIEIAVVLAHREDSVGVARCREAGLQVAVIPPSPADSLSDRIDEALEAADVELICLCGYLRLFRVGTRWQDRVLNIHPALLPDFGGQGMYGDHVHQAVLTAGMAESGCTVHRVDEQYDHGPVVLQKRCPVLPTDTPDTLAARVFDLECEAYPAALCKVIEEMHASRERTTR